MGPIADFRQYTMQESIVKKSKSNNKKEEDRMRFGSWKTTKSYNL